MAEEVVALTELSFVKEIVPVSGHTFTTTSIKYAIDHGFATDQANQISLIEGLHDRECLGTDKLIAVLDAGFVGANTGAVLAEMLEPLGISIWPLPKYSPELNPIELLWNYIKGICCGCPIPENDDETFTLLSDLFNDVINVQQFITHVDKFICQGALSVCTNVLYIYIK